LLRPPVRWPRLPAHRCRLELQDGGVLVVATRACEPGVDADHRVLISDEAAWPVGSRATAELARLVDALAGVGA
jgi:hypothetical protein